MTGISFLKLPKGICYRAEISDGDMHRFNNDDIPTHLKISRLGRTPVLVNRQRERSVNNGWITFQGFHGMLYRENTGCIRFGDSYCIHCQHALCIFQDGLGLKPMVKRDLIIIGVCRACPCQFTASLATWWHASEDPNWSVNISWQINRINSTRKAGKVPILDFLSRCSGLIWCSTVQQEMTYPSYHYAFLCNTL